MRTKPFTVVPHTRLDKRIEVNGPDGFRLWVDNDDVPHKVAEGGLKKMVKLLNKHWKDCKTSSKTSQNYLHSGIL